MCHFIVSLCVSAKKREKGRETRVAPWQLTTHSWLSNATEPPKRPLFNVTRWHCVMQAKHSDMICTDSLLKRKHCTCDSHREPGAGVCRGLAAKWLLWFLNYWVRPPSKHPSWDWIYPFIPGFSQSSKKKQTFPSDRLLDWLKKPQKPFYFLYTWVDDARSFFFFFLKICV